MKQITLIEALMPLLETIVDDLDKIPKEEAVKYLRDIGFSENDIDDCFNEIQ